MIKMDVPIKWVVIHKDDEQGEKKMKKLNNTNECVLLLLMKNASKEQCVQMLQNYIQSYGYLSDEAGEAVREIFTNKTIHMKVKEDGTD